MKAEDLKMNLQFFAESEGEGELNPDSSEQTQKEAAKDVEAEPTAEKKYTDEEVNDIVNAKFAKWKSEQKAEQDEAKKLSEMDDKEKHDYEMEKLKNQIEDYKRKEILLEMSKTANSMLSDKGINASEAILSFVVKETAEETSENVKAFIDLIEIEREAMKVDFEKRLGGRIPLDGNAATASHGEQLAKQANKQNEKPEYNPWAQN